MGAVWVGAVWVGWISTATKSIPIPQSGESCATALDGRDWVGFMPKDFSEALKPNGKYDKDKVIHIYRRLDPTLSEKEIIDRFGKLTKDKKGKVIDPESVLSYPTDFSMCVDSLGRWDWDAIYKLYKQYGVDKELAKAHFKTLKLTTYKPMVNCWEVPANLILPGASGFVLIKADPYPDNPPSPDRFDKLPCPVWVRYLAEKHGRINTFYTLLYNRKEAYDI